MIRVVMLALVTAAAPVAAEPLTDPVAEANLACAAIVAQRAESGRPMRGMTPGAFKAFVAAAVRREGAATGAFAERLMPRVQSRFDVLRTAFARAGATGEAEIDGSPVRAQDLDVLADLCRRRLGAT